MTGIETKLISAEDLAAIIQCGDVHRQEVEALASDLHESDRDNGTARLLAAMAAGWNETVSDYREE